MRKTAYRVCLAVVVLSMLACNGVFFGSAAPKPDPKPEESDPKYSVFKVVVITGVASCWGIDKLKDLKDGMDVLILRIGDGQWESDTVFSREYELIIFQTRIRFRNYWRWNDSDKHWHVVNDDCLEMVPITPTPTFTKPNQG